MQGERLGPYAIDRELGSGGMGKVYAASVADRVPGMETGDVVALKVVHPHLLETPGFFKRFMREAQLGQTICHENVVRTLDCDQEFGDGKAQCFLVMEYVEGQTLSDLLRELERVPEELCRHVAREICKGLSAIHDAGVVHRDLKPENVLITPDHVVKVMDLGVARLTDEALKLSRTGAFVGSVEYAAPEQFKGGDVDGRTDLHALGLLLYELSSGAHPYRGGSFHQVLGRVCDEDPRRLGDVNPQLSAFFEEVVHTLLVKDPRGRFSSATQVLDVLQDGEDSDWWHERARQVQAETKRPIRRIRIPRETAVYGRDDELTELHSLFELAMAGDGQVLLLEGEAGIGKSRLVDEFVGRLEQGGEDLNFLFGSYPPSGAATASGALSAAFREFVGEAGAAAHLSGTPLLVPAFDALLRGDAAPADAHPLTTEGLQSCFVSVLHSLAADRVTIVVIDDLHFAPDEGRGLFSALASRVPGHRVLLVGTSRPGVDSEWLAGLSRLEQTRRMALGRLGPKDLAELLKDCFGSEQLAVDLAGRIGLKSDGNPFFAFEIVRGLRDGQFITRSDDGSWVSTRVIDEIEIPSSVLDLVNARVSGLSEDERAILDVAACCGFEFDPLLVAGVLGTNRIPLLRQLGQIERAHRLVRVSGRRYVFDHHQVQEALYGSLSALLREEYHRTLAETLEEQAGASGKDVADLDGALVVDLCDHFLKGGSGERALRYLSAAETHLAALGLHGQAASMGERALAAEGLLVETERVEALIRLRRWLFAADLVDRAEACAREADALAERCGDVELRARAAHSLGSFLSSTRRTPETESVLRRALELAQQTEDARLIARVQCTIGYWLRSTDRAAEARDLLERVVLWACDAGDLTMERAARHSLALAFHDLGATAVSREQRERCVAINAELGHPGGMALSEFGFSLLSAGQLTEAREVIERSIELLRQTGDSTGELYAVHYLGWVHWSAGRRSDARQCFEWFLRRAVELHERQAELFALGNLAEFDELRAETGAEVDGYLDRAVSLAEETVRPSFAADALATHGEIAVARYAAGLGPADVARSILEDALERAIAAKSRETEAQIRCAIARLPGGDVEGARRALADNAESFRPEGCWRASRSIWLATGGRDDLSAAKGALDAYIATLDEPSRPGALAGSRNAQDLLVAWRAEFGEGDEEDEGPASTETATRVG